MSITVRVHINPKYYFLVEREVSSREARPGFRGQDGQVDLRGLRVGPFVVDTLLGRGGMSDVWTGHHEQDGVRVAIKLLRPSDRERENQFRDALRNEVHSE